MNDPIEFALKTQFSDLPSDVVSDAVRALIDTLGVAVAASKTELSRIIRDHAAQQFGGTASSLWQDGRKVSAAGAALANGMTIDSVDAHDGYKEAKGHVGCGVIPSAIALFEAENISDAQEFLTAITIGYEIGTRAGLALHRSASDYHTSGAWVALASAIIGARVLGLDAQKTREAIGIAEYHGPRSQMMRCIDHPTMVKDGSGWGAMAGVTAAYLAREGFTGAPAITVESPDLADIWSDLGEKWYIQEQYIKLYPVCRWAQPAVEAVLALMAQHEITHDQIIGISIETFHEARRLSAIPTNTEQAQYSLPFSVAAALVKGTIGVDEISADGLNDPDILRFAHMIEIEEGDEFNAVFPRERLARARIKIKSGDIFTSAVTKAQGDPEDRLSESVIADKFDRLCTPVLGTEAALQLRKTIDGLPGKSDVSGLFDLFRHLSANGSE